MSLLEELVGRRVVVRHLLPGQTGPSGGPAMSDVVGWVRDLDARAIRIERRDGSYASVPIQDIVTAKAVPEGPKRRRTRPAHAIDAEDLTRICTRGWPPVDTSYVGDWQLRAASGFTGRANSVAVHGDPGVDDMTALQRVVAFYAARGLPARAQVTVGSYGEGLFEGAGWAALPDALGGAVVQVGDLGAALRTARADADAAPAPDATVSIAEVVDDDWLAMYNRAGESDPVAARAVLEGPPTVAFVRATDPDGRLVAIGRAVATGEWAGLSCVEVEPSRRAQGLGRRVVEASLEWVARTGADKLYLQTMRDNHAALALYAPYGFTDHHDYRYLSPATP